MNRRQLLAIAPAALASSAGRDAIVINPQPLFPVSPYLYMQFMEPLGVTDSSVEAAWDYATDTWRKDFVAATADLAPGLLRYGGNFSRYYKWREGIGPVAQRPWMRNYDCGGKETNRVGTGEFVSLCRQVGADPLYCVNFEGEGIPFFKQTPEGNRAGTPEEAADWVSYCNDPDHAERRAHGHPAPYDVKLWQIGNETSYVRQAFSNEIAVRRTIDFARAMRARDRSVQLIGWGDTHWAPEMIQQAGEYLSYVAIHMMGQSPKRPDTLLAGTRYGRDPHGAWQELLEMTNRVEERIVELEGEVAGQNWPGNIAVTEGHLSLKPHNANPLLMEWVSAVYHARSMNIYQRHGAKVKIATAADFNGTRWTVMAVHTPVPKGNTFLLPVGSIMRLFKTSNGESGIQVVSAPKDLDIAAARTGNRLFLHVLNLNSRAPVATSFTAQGFQVTGGRVLEIAPGDLRTAVDQDNPDCFRPKERPFTNQWTFPAASVSAVELSLSQ